MRQIGTNQDFFNSTLSHLLYDLLSSQPESEEELKIV